MKKYWLVKSEAACYSIDDFARDSQKLGKVAWTGIRNYQARNFMRDEMSPGDFVLFYHSNSEPNAVVGTAEVVSKAKPDETAFDKKDEHFDPKSKRGSPTWVCPDLRFVQKFKTPVTLAQIKFHPSLGGITLAQKGSRLSVMPIEEKHFKKIVELGQK